MKKPQLLTIVTILSALLFSGTEVLAQEEDLAMKLAGEYGEQAAVVCPLCCACPRTLFLRPAETRHSLQLSAGVSFRF